MYKIHTYINISTIKYLHILYIGMPFFIKNNVRKVYQTDIQVQII